MVLPAALAAATVEEAVFRRLGMDYVLQQGGGWVVQVLAAGLVFGLLHGIFGLTKWNAMAAFRAATMTGMLGALLGVVYLIGGRSLAPCITAHFLITLALEPGLLTAATERIWPVVPSVRLSGGRLLSNEAENSLEQIIKTA